MTTLGAATAKEGRAMTGPGKWADSSSVLRRASGGHDVDRIMCKLLPLSQFYGHRWRAVEETTGKSDGKPLEVRALSASP